MLGFWMARVLTKPFYEQSEKFRSTLLIDFLSSGVIGLLYTLIVGPLTEGIASSVAHALTPVVPRSLDVHEYTPFQRHMRPFELLLLAGAMWWGLNSGSASEHLARLSTYEETEPISKWDTLITMAKALAVTTGYLVIVVTMLSILEPEGLASTLATAAAGMGVGTAALLLARRIGRKSLTTVLTGTGRTQRLTRLRRRLNNMRASGFRRQPSGRNIWLAVSPLICAGLVWNYAAGLEGKEFSGGRITGPILNLSDFGLLLFVVATILSFFHQRIAGIVIVLASIFCLPLYIYFTAPGPFRSVFRGKYSVPAPSSFVWRRWAVAGILALFVTMLIGFRAVVKVRSQEPTT
jgi:hypothetical protein